MLSNGSRRGIPATPITSKRGKNNNDRRSRGPIEPTIDSQLNGHTFPVGSIGFIEFDIRHRLYLVLSSSAKVIRQAVEI